MNTAGCMLLREIFGKTRSSLDTDWLAISSRLRAAPIKFFAKVDYRKTIGPDRAR